MSAPLIQPQDCCSTCTSSSSSGSGTGQQGPPGPAGPQGPQGVAGANGVNAFTTLSSPNAVPAYNQFGFFNVVDSTWIGNGQLLFLENAGYLIVTGIPSATQVILLNQFTYSSFNTPPGTNIPQGSKLVPGGIIGPQGHDGSAVPSVIAYTAAPGTPPVANPGLNAGIAINTTDGGQWQWYNNAWH